MKTPALLLLAALMAVSTATPAKGIKLRSGGSHHSTSHSEPSGATTHLPRPHNSASSEPTHSEAAQYAASAQAHAKDQRAAMTDKLNAELAAQRAATPPGAPVGQLLAKAPLEEPVKLAANEKRVTRPVTVGKTAAIVPTAGADITTLVPRDSSKKPHDEIRRDDRYNSRGVNCSLYPARC